MVRHYVWITKKGDNYAKNDLYLVKEAIQSKEMYVSGAARRLKKSRSTLYTNGRHGIKSTTIVRNIALWDFNLNKIWLI